MTPSETRNLIVELTELLSSAELQLEYERNVPHVFVAAEIVEMFCTDNFHPKFKTYIEAFNELEHKLLARLYGDTCKAGEAVQARPAASMLDVLKLPEWRSMMETAKIVHRAIVGSAG